MQEEVAVRGCENEAGVMQARESESQCLGSKWVKMPGLVVVPVVMAGAQVVDVHVPSIVVSPKKVRALEFETFDVRKTSILRRNKQLRVTRRDFNAWGRESDGGKTKNGA